MNKLILTVATLALFTTPSLADGSFDGFYAGVDGLYNHSKIDGSKDNNWGGRVNAGYGKTYNKIYLGAEANLDFSGLDTHINGVKVKKDLGYGATARLGYEFSPAYLGYTLVGYERADIKYGDDKEAYQGVRYGIGAETKVRGNMIVRTEISQSNLKHDDSKLKDLKTTLGLAVRF